MQIYNSGMAKCHKYVITKSIEEVVLKMFRHQNREKQQYS